MHIYIYIHTHRHVYEHSHALSAVADVAPGGKLASPCQRSRIQPASSAKMLQVKGETPAFAPLLSVKPGSASLAVWASDEASAADGKDQETNALQKYVCTSVPHATCPLYICQLEVDRALCSTVVTAELAAAAAELVAAAARSSFRSPKV